MALAAACARGAPSGTHRVRGADASTATVTAPRTDAPMTDDVRALRRLASRLLRPDQSRHAALAPWARAALDDAPPHTPSAWLWAEMARAGHIPARWAGDVSRRFDCARDVDLAWPPDAPTAVTLASDPTGVETVEVLLRNAWSAFAPGSSRAPIIRWSVLPRERVQPSPARPGRDLVRATHGTVQRNLSRFVDVARGLMSNVLGVREPDEERTSVPDLPPAFTFDSRAYEEAMGYDLSPAAADAFARDLGHLHACTRDVTDLRDPFVALRRVWELGYTVDERTDEGFVVLAPEAPVDPIAPRWTRNVPVAGLRFVSPPVPLRSLAPGQAVRLEREPSNAHDSNAIRAVRDDGVVLGYVPRNTAAALTPLLDRGVAHGAEIARVDPLATNPERAVFLDVFER